jgi:hypothetical protein
MYSEITNSSKFNIQGLECKIPEPGYVVNLTNGTLEFAGIYSRSEIPSQQFWERTPLPDWYKQKIKEENAYNKKKNVNDPPYYDEQLEEYTKQEWYRRLNGFWFMNNGNPFYLTGSHYMYLQWWQLDIGYPKFRIPDLEYFYFLQYCIEDPYCMGMLEITKRRFGKTFRGGLFITEYITRTREANGGIQSKTGSDAKKMFGKAVIKPFKKLPRFFRPEYDMSLGITPKTEIRFQQTNVRGKEAEQYLDKEELGSMIDHQSADTLAYDGQKIHRYFGDEWCKTVEVDVYDRHEVVRYCLLDDEGKIIGKALYSSTVEQLETEKDGVQKAAIKLWDASNQNNKGSNGRTESGLYRFFMTADRARNFDRYGFPNIEKTIKEIIADREMVIKNPKVWAARVRKEARTIQEAFYVGNNKAEFNNEKISNQLEYLKENPVFLRTVRVIPNDKIVKSPFIGKQDTIHKKAGIMDDENGSWFIHEFPNEENKITQDGDFLYPANTELYVMGVDTVRDLDAKEGSEPVALIMKKSCIVDGVETGLKPVAMRLSSTRLGVHFDMEVALMCMFYGCKVCYEIDARDDYYRFFNGLKMAKFLEWTPTALRSPTNKSQKYEPGVRSGNPFQLYQQLQITKMYLDGTDNVNYNGNIHRIVYPSLLEQLRDYDHANRTKSDQVIALMMALTTMIGQQQAPKRIDNSKINILPTHKIKMMA